MPHSQMIMSKKTNILNFAPRLRLANQTDKLVAAPSRLSFRFETARGWAALGFRDRLLLDCGCLAGAAVAPVEAAAAVPVSVFEDDLAGGGRAGGADLA